MEKLRNTARNKLKARKALFILVFSWESSTPGKMRGTGIQDSSRRCTSDTKVVDTSKRKLSSLECAEYNSGMGRERGHT
jgi:hypothetical protein